MKVNNTRPVSHLLIKILISFWPLSSIHLFQSNQRFQAIEFVDRHVSENLIFPKLSSQNMRGFDHAKILSPSFHGLQVTQGTPDTMTCLLWPKIRPKIPWGYFRKNWVGVCCTLQETLILFQTKICDFPYPISDLIKNFILYFRPEALEFGAWQAVKVRTR